MAELMDRSKVEWKAVRASGVKNMAEEANELSQTVAKPAKKSEELTLDDL